MAWIWLGSAFFLPWTANVRSALEIAWSARTILGTNGITHDFPPLRHALNLESVLTYEGTREVHTLVLGGENRHRRVRMTARKGLRSPLYKASNERQ